MFDTIIVNADMLPVSEEERVKIANEWLQTKDFNNTLSAIHIRDNRLMEELSKDVFIDLNFDGSFRFYTLVGDSGFEIQPVEECQWYEFEALFTDGNLIEIKQVPTDGTEIYL